MHGSALVAITLALGIGAGAMLAGYHAQASPGAGDAPALTAKGLREGGSPVMGDPGAPVTIVEYGDYQCTFCYRFHQTTLNAILERYVETGRASLVFKDFALNGPDSVLAAEASHCAGDQGAYWGYHDEIYGNWAGERTGWVTRDALAGFAAAVGLDAEEFDACMDRRAHRAAVLEAYEAGREIGIDATPSFLIFNDERVIKIRGNQPLEAFERAIGGLADQT